MGAIEANSDEAVDNLPWLRDKLLYFLEVSRLYIFPISKLSPDFFPPNNIHLLKQSQIPLHHTSHWVVITFVFPKNIIDLLDRLPVLNGGILLDHPLQSRLFENSPLFSLFVHLEKMTRLLHKVTP